MKKVLIFSLAFMLIFLLLSCTGVTDDGDDVTGTTEFIISDFDGTSKSEAETLVTANSNDPAGNAALAIFETEEFLDTYVKGFDEDFSEVATYITNISEAASELSYIFGDKVYSESEYYSGPKSDISTQITIIFDNVDNLKNIFSTSEIASYLAIISARLNKIVNQTDINIIVEHDPAGHFMNLVMNDVSDTTPYIPSNGIAFDYRDFMMDKTFVDGIILFLDEQIFNNTTEIMMIEFTQIAYTFEYSDYTEMQNYLNTFTTTYVSDEFLDDLIYLLNEYSETGELEAIYKMDSGATPTTLELESDFSVIFDRIAPNDSSPELSMTDIINYNMVKTPDISNIISMLDMMLENYHKMVQFEAMSRFQNRERLNFMEANIHMMDIMESSTDTTTLQKQNFKMSEMRQMEINNEEQVRLNGTAFGDMGDILDILRSVLPSGTLTISDDGVVLVEDYVTEEAILSGDISLEIDFGGISDEIDLADLNLLALSGIETPLATLVLMEPYDGTDVNSDFIPELKNLMDKINGVDYTGEDVEAEISYGTDFIFDIYIYDLLNEAKLIELFENQ
jgi:hypothetical protein